jgi:hypothetical protein
MAERESSKVETVFEEQGSLTKPGPIGRIVRFLFGAWLLWAAYTLLRSWSGLVDTTPPGRMDLWVFVIFAFWVTPYAVNIGFTQNWRRAPQVAVAVLAAVALVIDLAVYGTWWAPPLGVLVWVWLVYLSAHLGSSFVLSALVATPGCEMRAIPHLWSLATGRSTKEHYCPGAFLDRIDRWETQRAQ